MFLCFKARRFSNKVDDTVQPMHVYQPVEFICFFFIQRVVIKKRFKWVV